MGVINGINVNVLSSSELDFYEVIADFLSKLNNSDYGNLFIVKGGIALTSVYSNTFNLPLNRKTIDLDLHWISRDSWENLIVRFNEIFNLSGSSYTYSLISRRGFAKNPNGDSLDIIASDGSKDMKFSVDMNFGDNLNMISTYTIKGVSFRGYPIEYMLSDKMKVVSSKLVYRRIKDLFDLYYISMLKPFDFDATFLKIREKNDLDSIEEIFILGGYNKLDLEHAYNSLKDINICLKDGTCHRIYNPPIC